jgi:hypothetical protein
LYALLPAGTYNDAATDPADKCKKCPEGTTTAPNTLDMTNEANLDDAAALVDALEKCSYTLPGFAQQSSEVAGQALTKCPIGKPDSRAPVLWHTFLISVLLS